MQHIEFKSKAKLIISKELLAQISYFHHKVGKFEWSGLVFYKIVSGDISDPGSLVLKAERMYLMDVGSYSYTEFSPDESIVDFYQKYPEAVNMKWGMAHSHQEFSTFFSGTDMDELKSNAGSHNFYLSLIVNFMDGGNFCAKIGIIAEAEVQTEYKFNHGLSFKGLENPLPSKEKRLMTINCDIEYDVDTLDVERFNSIKKTKEEEHKKKTAQYTPKTSFPTYPSRQLSLNSEFSEGFSKYIPKTPLEMESFLAKALSMDIGTTENVKEVLDNLVQEKAKYGEDQFDSIYWDAFDYGLVSTYWKIFEKPLVVEHHNQFFRQCIMAMDVHRLSGYDFYDQIIEVFEQYIDVPEVEEEEPENKQLKIHQFSGLDKAIKGADKIIKKFKKDGKSNIK